MAEIADLVKDLEELNKDCRKIKVNAEVAITRRDTSGWQYFMREYGRKVSDFYEKTFVPKYSKMPDERVAQIGLVLEHLSLQSSEARKKNSYFRLNYLLVPGGSKPSDPNYLEKSVLQLVK